MQKLLLAVSLAVPIAAGGCGDRNAPYLTESRLAKGLVIILPGIEGESPLNHDIRKGLVAAGVYRGLPIYSWGRPIPLAGPLINQMDFIGNRLAGARVAEMVVSQQDRYPGRPVYLVGHSGGGGIAVFAAEALPKNRKVDGLILLSASISKGYDLTKALNRCRNGIVNFYNRSDAALLGVGTTIVGNVDGGHGPSAGLVGFEMPRSGDPKEKILAYKKLYQIEATPAMTRGSIDPHASTTDPDFVATYVARWILASHWPPRGSYALR